MSKPIAIVIGAGKNIGATTAKAFSAKGYRVAQVARSIDTSSNNDDHLAITADLSKSGDVSNAFAKVRKTWGEPSIVFYNGEQAGALHKGEDGNPFTISEADFTSDMMINTVSPYVAMKEAIASFESLKNSSGPKRFFFTGNKLATPGFLLPAIFSLGVGKSATAHMIDSAVEAYKDKPYKFYYIDERSADGGPQYKVSGEAHADFITSLLEDRNDVPTRATFVKDKGYSKF